ncbi:hypothetical protein [Pseudaminobacter sp. NGMCC 1.201702]|uniref:hypothetical protein n=1 Tax=Pseudaminobacter sp. NGMCC 1.201702 TaxID=3391825 RepID=UPI0039F1275C
MGKFKVGDRVRLVKDGRSTTGAIGKMATISAWSSGKIIDNGEYLLDIDPPVDYKTLACTPNFTRAKPDCFELVTESKFKVGDRVNWTRVSGEFDGSTIEAIDVDTGFATLRIEAGKFYKTRDGLKVGPMVDRGGYYTPNGGRHHYNSDGKRRFGDDDGTVVIAEWPADDPASNDNEPPVAMQQQPARFKVGDRVRGTGYSHGYKGAVVEGVITQTDRTSLPYLIDMTNGDTTWLHEDGVVLITSNTPAIVCLLDNGQPKPAVRPFVHGSRAAAEKEAARLSHKYPGKEFGVYEFVSSAKEDAVYEHEWQRLAAQGQFFSAITNLRQLSGLDSEAAQLAVGDWLNRAA